MVPVDFHLDRIFIFFIYGLAFFTMGVALALEARRTPRLADRRYLIPMALFGLFHGIHEWLEIIILQGIWVGTPFAPELSLFRVIWLAISFVPLVVFSLLILFSQSPNHLDRYLFAALVVVFGLAVATNYRLAPESLVNRVDVLARYLLATPGSLLAGLALWVRSKQVRTEGRLELAKTFHISAIVIVIYGLSQIFVPKIDMFPAVYINTDLFQSLFGFPVQLVRATSAALMMLSMLQSIQIVDREREQQLFLAQQERLAALEQIQRDLVEREMLRRNLLRHVVIAQEDERARIARELHDETAQILTGISLDLATLKGKLPKEKTYTQLIERLHMLSRQMSTSVYRLIRDLRPVQLDDLGLVAALRNLSDPEGSPLGVEALLEIVGTAQRLDPLVETVIFRVAQEALLNVSRHAKTKGATVRLIFEAHKITLQVVDEGVGFDLNEYLLPPRGWGLAGMRERAESMGGRLNIRSGPMQGTTVEVIIPIDNKLAELGPVEASPMQPSGVGS